MKSLLKKILFYDKLYALLKESFLYQARKKANGQIANILYGNPSKDFFVIGVTGTNGKTTTVNLIHKILNENVAKSMLVSTANIKIGSQELKNVQKMTSLDIYDLQSNLAIARDSGCKIAILEASSQGLHQYRFEGVKFDCAVLTNITRDHLDYHKTMDNYAKTKKMLFSYVLNNKKNNKYGIFPADDQRGRKRFEEMAFDKKINYSINSSAFLRAEDIIEGKDSTTFQVNYLGKKYTIQTKLLGTFNVYNILAAISVAIEIGVPIEKAIASVADFGTVEGRMQLIKKNDMNCFVDFAHTPDALEKTLSYLSNTKEQGRLITVFGATGCKDKEKRPLMGTLVEQYSDIMVITDDDPDTENRFEIINLLKQDIKTKKLGVNLFIIPERRVAIDFAKRIGKQGDTIMFAGKGHESIQYTNFGKYPWSDADEVAK